MAREPGLFPTTYLTLLLSQRAAKPGDLVSLRVDGTDAGSMIRGKVLPFEKNLDGEWRPVGVVICTSSAAGQLQWHGATNETFAVTLEGYSGIGPMYFKVPPVSAGDYRIRVHLSRPDDGSGDLRDRTATLYTSLRVLDAGPTASA